MKHFFTLIFALLLAPFFAVRAAEATATRPNVLFIIADDASRHFGEAYGCNWVKTPNIDRLAKQGLVFGNAYTPTSKCAPSRASILTGRNPWQLEDAANHQPYFPAKFTAFSEALARAGIQTGAAGKTWGPGEAKLADGSQRDFALGRSGGKGANDPGAGLTAFLKKRTPGTPFFYWFGSQNPHRAYKPDSGIAAGKKPSDIDRVPAYWPDNNLIRRDMLDYAIEVEAYDAQVGSLLAALEASGEAKNTLIIVTSDHGMPFPRVKGHTYDDAHHIPFVATWPAGIAQPGRRVAEFISFIDLAPTFLELFGVNGAAQGMSPITGRSFTDLLRNEAQGERGFVIVGRERNDALARPGSPAGLGYPARAIRSGNLFYVHNFAPDRWPCGNPELGSKDSDASPSKTLATESGEKDPFWQHAFGKRPAEQLFDLASDPDCVVNLAANPAFAEKLAALRETLMSELKKQNDPRALGRGDVFDQYLSPRTKAGEATPLVQPRKPDGTAAAAISGEMKQWHKVTLTLDGPFARERDNEPNPFTDLAFNVTFTHESGAPNYTVPGYFATDGDAANSSAESGTKWRAHLSPDKAGQWNYVVSFTKGKEAALGGKGEALKPFDGVRGSFNIGATDKAGRDFRAKGRLQYVGKHYLQFADTKEYFLKAGPDAPETLLAYADFDGTKPGSSDVQRSGEAKPTKALKTWQPHMQDWKIGDPAWKSDKGKGLIGALNYLAGKGVNAFSVLTYNAAGDGDNVWPFVERDDKLHYDCSKLDQWGVVFDHATALGLYLHFKLQENESDDERLGMGRKPGKLPEALDGGKLGIERKLYCRELIARFGHALALNWNIGEENTQSTEEVRDMVKFLHDTDPYQHHIVLHTFPPEQDKVYQPLLGDKSLLTGVSLQNSWKAAHQSSLKWLRASAAAGRPWVVANDEQNPAGLGVPPDPGYKGHDGIAVEKQLKDSKDEGNFLSKPYTMLDIRKLTLWGSLMAGGAGVEYYFGYQLPENDLICEDFRSRDKSWDFCRIALEFFRDEKVPFSEMQNTDALIGNAKNDNSKFCFAKADELYLVYLPNGGTTDLDLSTAQGVFTVKWFNPREGGVPTVIGAASLNGGSKGTLTAPSADDWLAVIAKVAASAK